MSRCACFKKSICYDGLFEIKNSHNRFFSLFFATDINRLFFFTYLRFGSSMKKLRLVRLATEFLKPRETYTHTHKDS